MPVPVSSISTDNHKVVVGLSDAYYYDEYIMKGIVQSVVCILNYFVLISRYTRWSIKTPPFFILLQLLHCVPQNETLVILNN